MNVLIDIRTALLLNAVVGLIFCLCLGHLFRTRRTYPGFLPWTLASLCVFVTMALIYVRDLIPDWASVTASNAFGLVSVGLMARGLALFIGRKTSPWWLILPVLVGTVGSVLFTDAHPDVRARIIFISLVMLVPVLHALVLARAVPSALPGISNTWILTSLGEWRSGWWPASC